MTSKNVNEIHAENLSKTEKIALKITNIIGTFGSFIIIFFWTILWLGWNMFAPVSLRFDPYPGFILWLFISNMVQIFLMPLLMIGQNLQSKHSEITAENNYELDVKQEKNIELLMESLVDLKSISLDILMCVGKENADNNLKDK